MLAAGITQSRASELSSHHTTGPTIALQVTVMRIVADRLTIAHAVYQMEVVSHCTQYNTMLRSKHTQESRLAAVLVRNPFAQVHHHGQSI